MAFLTDYSSLVDTMEIGLETDLRYPSRRSVTAVVDEEADAHSLQELLAAVVFSRKER